MGFIVMIALIVFLQSKSSRNRELLLLLCFFSRLDPDRLEHILKTGAVIDIFVGAYVACRELHEYLNEGLGRIKAKSYVLT